MTAADVTPWLARLEGITDAGAFTRAAVPFRAFNVYCTVCSPGDSAGLTPEQRVEVAALRDVLVGDPAFPLSRADAAIATVCSALEHVTTAAPAVARATVFSAWLTFARATLDDGDAPIALLVARQIGHDAEAADAMSLAASARLLEGFIHLRTADLRATEHVLQYAEQLATRAGDRSTVLRTQLGYANIAWLRGNLPEAERRLGRLIRAAQGAAYDVLPTILLMRGAVAHARGKHVDAVVWALRSLEASIDPDQEARALTELASFLTEFPDSFISDTARRALEYVTEYGPERSGRHHAAISLISLAIDQQDTAAFLRWRTYLASCDLRPRHAVYYGLYRAKGARVLALSDDREVWLARAARVAALHALAQLSFAVDEEAAMPTGHTDPTLVHGAVSPAVHEERPLHQQTVSRGPEPTEATPRARTPSGRIPRRVLRVAETVNTFLNSAPVA